MPAFANNMVFYYAPDLKDAAETLATYLGCTVVRTTLGAGAIKSSQFTSHSGANKVAWLVGHGNSSDEKISTAAGKNWVLVDELLDWCTQEGYTTVVDTCCEPDSRAKKAASYGMTYYASVNGHAVTQIQNYTNVNDWWTANYMAKR